MLGELWGSLGLNSADNIPRSDLANATAPCAGLDQTYALS